MGPQGAQGNVGPAGPSGVVGSATAPLGLITLTTNVQALPGNLTLDVASNTTPTMSAEADGILFLNAAAGTYGLVEIRLVLDGTVIQSIRTEVVNYLAGNMSAAWHLHTMQPLTAGTHDLHVDARVLAGTGQVQVNTPYAGRLSALLVQ